MAFKISGVLVSPVLGFRAGKRQLQKERGMHN